MVTVLVDLGTAPLGQAVVLVLAQDPTPPPDKGPEFGKASPIGLVVVLVLLIATVFLVRSMTKHLRRVPASFDDPAERTSVADPDEGAGEPVAPRTVDRGSVDRSRVDRDSVDRDSVDRDTTVSSPADVDPPADR